jgi:adenylate kinase
VTGQIYHLKFKPPPADVGPPGPPRRRHRGGRPHRVEKYHRDTTPIIPYYAARGLLKSVDGVGTPDEVLMRITVALQAADAVH